MPGILFAIFVHFVVQFAFLFTTKFTKNTKDTGGRQPVEPPIFFVFFAVFFKKTMKRIV